MWKAPFGFVPQLGNAVAHSLIIIIVQGLLYKSVCSIFKNPVINYIPN